jgi:NTP pyrophosphatase (non-canonical NTP hydrolase)
MGELQQVRETMSDAQTTVSELRECVRRFVVERDWRQFHSPKNLAMALAIEAAELMEHFQWITTECSRTMADTAQKRTAIAEEVADVFCYVLAMANELDIDLSTAFHEKMLKNARKYPVSEYRGRFGPEDSGSRR